VERCTKDHKQSVLVAVGDGDYAWFRGVIQSPTIPRAQALRLYPRGVQVADDPGGGPCIYCAHCTYHEARLARLP
jgi:hypothetical protein